MNKIYTLLSIILLMGCQQPKNTSNTIPIQVLDSVFALTKSNKNSEGVFIFNNGKDIILNWTERDEHNQKNNLLKFAIFHPENLQFDSIQTVPSSQGLQMHAESMAKTAIKPDGTYMAVYRKKSPKDRNRFGGHLYYTFSKDRGKTWSKEYKLVADTASTSQSFYDLAVLPNQNLGLTWLDSRSKRRGKTLYLGQTDEQNLFSHQQPVAFSTCECCRTDLFVDSRGYIHIAYRNLIEPDEDGFDDYGKTEIRDMYYLQSKDTAHTFTQPMPISKDNWHVYGCPHTGPSMAYDGQNLGVVWFTAANHQPGLYFTLKKAGSFTTRKQLSVEGRHPQMVATGGKFYRVYEEYYEKHGKGFYKIVLNIHNSDGSIIEKEISRPETKNNHPVLSIFDHYLLASWVNTDTRHPKIVYKILDLNKLNI